MRRPFVVVFCLSTLVWAQSRAAHSPEELVITNVNVVDTRRGLIEPNRTVVVRRGRIEAVAKVGLIGTGRTVHVVNAGGRYLIPGLWDMHVHSAGTTAAAWDEKIIYPLFIANGVTGVRDMGGDPDLIEQRRRRIEHGELLGPHLILAGPSVNDPRGNGNERRVSPSAEAGDVTAASKGGGTDPFKSSGNVPEDGFLTMGDDGAVSVTALSSGGRKSIEHLTSILLACSSEEDALQKERADALAKHDVAGYSATGMKAMATYNPAKAQDLFVQLASNNTWEVPALVWSQASASVDNPEFTADPRLHYVPASVRQQWNPEKLLEEASPQRLADLKKESSRGLELANAMHRAGVPFMAGTDGPGPYIFPGFSLHDELELLVKSGFSPFQALQTATFNPALFLVKLDQYGVVEQDHVADLVLLEANPLEDIRNTRKIAAVVVAGKYYSRGELDKMLAEVEKAAEKQ